MSPRTARAGAPTISRDALPLDIYVRVSSVGGRDGDSFRSPAEQEADGRSQAARLKRPVGEVVTDLDASGGTQDRDGLALVLDRIRSGESAGVIVYKLDRLSREDAGAVERLLSEIEDAGGKVYAPDLPDDFRSASGELQLGLITAVNRYTRSLARERFDSAARGAIERGVPVAIRTAVGYRQRDDRRLEPDPQWKQSIIDLRDRAAEGEGYSSLARWLNAEGVPTRTDGRCSGPKLDPATGLVIMGRRRAKICGGALGEDGRCTVCGRLAPEWSRQVVQGRLSNRIDLGEVSWGPYVNPDAHEAITDLPTFVAALQPRPGDRRPPRHGARVWLLSGVAVCANCGYRLSHISNGKGVDSYRCVGHSAAGPCPGPISIEAGRLQRLVTAHYLRPLDEAEILHTGPAFDMKNLEDKLKAAERRLDTVTAPESIDALGDKFAATVARYRAERDAAAQELGEARASVSLAAKRIDPDEARADWDSRDTLAQREALTGYYQAVAVRRTASGVLAQFWTHEDSPAAPLRQRFPDELDAVLLGVEVDAVKGQLPAELDPAELIAA